VPKIQAELLKKKHKKQEAKISEAAGNEHPALTLVKKPDDDKSVQKRKAS